MEKTGGDVVLPVLPPLQASLEATPAGRATFIATVRGEPFSKEGLGNWFKEACVAAGVSGSAHGLRKAGATRAAEAGATEMQLMSLFGWESSKMAALYTRKAQRGKMAQAAAPKLMRSGKS